MEPNTILIIDSNLQWTGLLVAGLGRRGFAVHTAAQVPAALDLATRLNPSVILINPAIPGGEGLEILRRLRGVVPAARFIMVAGHASPELMVEAIRERVSDFLFKPVSFDSLEQAINRALEESRPGEAPQRLPEPPLPQAISWEAVKHGELPCRDKSAVLIGQSRAMALVRQQIEEITPTGITVLIRGESGTGKGVVARLIHEQSKGKGRSPLIAINCPAIPETLMESELFGHEAGAFTDARGCKPGRLELARGGTVFMDEIGEIPPPMQVKLLQVIERKAFERVGGHASIRLDARILAATNAPLENMIAAGAFRADLFYRLNEYCIVLPPLRERLEDVPLLVEHFLRLYGPEFGRPELGVTSRTMALLMNRPWNGNVRELESMVRRFALTGREETLLDRLLQETAPAAAAAEGPPRESETLRKAEIQAITSALMEARWNQRRAAVLLGISYSALRRRIDKYGLKTSGNPRSTAVAATMPRESPF